MQVSQSKCSNTSIVRACVNCQKRKSRCMRGSVPNDPCSYCTKTGKTCSFESPPDRTPLTRKNLDAAELRCTQLQNLLLSLNPDLDIESALKRSTIDNKEGEHSSYATEESDETTPHSYEWHEGSLSPINQSNSTNDNDGMATLSSHDSGYLGSSSGSQLLGEIDSVIHVSNTTKDYQIPAHRKRRRQSSNSSGFPTPESLDLPLSYISSRLIDSYFLLYNTSYPILHETTFRNRVKAGHRQRLVGSPWKVVYHMVLTIGHWLSSKESEHQQSGYYSAARSYLSLQMLESGTIETVQAFLLMGNYLQKRDRTNTGYNFIGLAYRMALGLGLHREPPGSEDTVGHERRRQLFWIIYCFESGFNITTGRPPAMSDSFTDTRLPRNIDDKELHFNAPVPAEVSYPTTYSAIICHTQLAKIADTIYHEFLLAKIAGTKVEFRVAETMERDLNRWRDTLPKYFRTTDCPSWFRAPRAVILWKEQNLRILLWRGSQKRHSYLPRKVDADAKCLEIAMQTIHDIAAFCMGYESSLNNGITWYATYFIFQATLVLEASYLTEASRPEEDRLAWQHSVSKARACLKALEHNNRPARRCLEMLDRIHSQFQLLPQLDPALDPACFLPMGLNQDATATFTETNAISETNEILELPSENEFSSYGEIQSVYGEETTDPSLRMLLNEGPLDFMDNMPLDLLLDDWTA
nr:C6 transcription factor [Colletotrichum truncatum]KAF6787354.1 C6 transcription factor [Colletotrichum truncatum]